MNGRCRRFIHSDNKAAAAIANPSLPNLRSLTPTVRDAILSDLNSVDINNNGIIDSNELKTLLSKHATSFTDEEIVELTELFYASTGGSGVEVMRFLEALDAAIDEKSTSGGGEMGEKEPLSPLVAKGTFKTHPLGIGTCASEYSELNIISYDVRVFFAFTLCLFDSYLTQNFLSTLQCSPRRMESTQQNNSTLN